MPTQIATQKLRKVEGTMNFESNEFSIPDLTESEIATFFTDEGETVALWTYLQDTGTIKQKIRQLVYRDMDYD